MVGNNPHALLDLKRYLADSQAEFLDMQAGILKQYCAEEQFTTTNYTAISTGADWLRTQKLDFATYTAYPNGGSDNIGAEGFRLGDSKPVLFAAAYYQQLGGISGVMEMQPGPVNWGSYNPCYCRVPYVCGSTTALQPVAVSPVLIAFDRFCTVLSNIMPALLKQMA
ncbi:beta-galactosidase [Niabella sp. W65]|nr:beta-galactosidase [Niabella sp. W65]MCH7364798.1 beta-galactosidase [Niabella sp. W65]